MMENRFSSNEKSEGNNLLLGRTEGEVEEEFIERIVEEYRQIDSQEQFDFKDKVRHYLYEENRMTDREMAVLLEENPKIIGSWRRRNGLKPNDWERKTPPKKSENRYHRTEREKYLVVKLVLAGLNYRKDSNDFLERSSGLKKLLDNVNDSKEG